VQSRLFSYNCLPSTSELYTAPNVSHVDFIFSQSGPFHNALDIEQKAEFGQKKLALNKTNISLAWVNIFALVIWQRYQLLIFRGLTNVLYLSLWTGTLYWAYLSDTSGHRRSFRLKLVSARFWLISSCLKFSSTDWLILILWEERGLIVMASERCCSVAMSDPRATACHNTTVLS